MLDKLRPGKKIKIQSTYKNLDGTTEDIWDTWTVVARYPFVIHIVNTSGISRTPSYWQMNKWIQEGKIE